MKSKLKVKSTIQNWDGQKVRVDQVKAPRRNRHDSSLSATVSHDGRKPTAILDISLATKEIERVRELGRWLNSVADWMGDE